MKNLLTSAFLLVTIIAYSQKEVEINVTHFEKITVSPKINLILKKGEKEALTIKYNNIDPDKINVEVNNGKLHLYLDDARIVDKREYSDDYNYKTSIYRDAEVTAYVTYTYLNLLEVRGDQEVNCSSMIDSHDFTLRVYGATEIILDSLHAKNFKALIYGENKIRINAGKASNQTYVLYGENKIENSNLLAHSIHTRIYGDGRLKINALDEVKINAIGDPDIYIKGNPMVSKGIVIGKLNIERNY
jgi:hypothetical protein